MADSRYTLQIDETLAPCPAAVGLIWGETIDPPRQTESPPAFLQQLLGQVVDAGPSFLAEERRANVRRMLRHGAYHPSGRGKPASEFLLRAAVAGEFPLVNAPVDVNNAISLESGLPGSIFDASTTGPELLLRRGRAGERYVFNPAGQEIDLEDLLLVCRHVDGAWSPCGNPVKDAMTTKVGPGTRDVIAVLYAPFDEPRERWCRWVERFEQLLSEHCGAKRTGSEIVARPDATRTV